LRHTSAQACAMMSHHTAAAAHTRGQRAGTEEEDGFDVGLTPSRG
jgi:hypothetical protein